MSSDISRQRFDPANDFSSVLMQQGRVQLDADWNEWNEILDRRWRSETIDIIGRGTVPKETPDGFKIEITGGVLTIGRGRIYVDGLQVENHGDGNLEFDPILAESRGVDPLPYEKQPYCKDLGPLPEAGGPHLVYLDVWEREVTYVEDPNLVENAVGVDTTSRVQTAWQVRVLPNVGDGANCATPDQELNGWLDIIQPSAGRLTTRAVGVATPADPCLIAPSGGYRGLENRTYRVEIHDGGPIGDATFKWSRDNASVASGVSAIENDITLTVDHAVWDSVRRFSPGNWVEITDDWREFSLQPGEMRQIDSVNDSSRTITLKSALTAGLFPVDGQNLTDPERHTRIKRWDQDPGGPVVIDVLAAGTPFILEDGVQITFTTDPDGGAFRPGDYWIFVARTADASVEELNEAPPRGIHHHYCRLAVVTFPNAAADCRHICGPCQAMHVIGINWKNDDFLALESSYITGYGPPGTATFADGLQITLDTAPDKDSVVPATMVVTIEVPLTFFDRGLQGASNAPDPSLSFILRGNISVLKSTITWKPTPETVKFIRELLQRSKKVPSLLARVSLNGFAIFSDRDDPRMNLDGQALGTPRALSSPYTTAERIDLMFPSNNCKCASNFQSWFFLGSPSYRYSDGFRDRLFVGIGGDLI